jgi:hypothetical protein
MKTMAMEDSAMPRETLAVGNKYYSKRSVSFCIRINDITKKTESRFLMKETGFFCFMNRVGGYFKSKIAQKNAAILAAFCEKWIRTYEDVVSRFTVCPRCA